MLEGMYKYLSNSLILIIVLVLSGCMHKAPTPKLSQATRVQYIQKMNCWHIKGRIAITRNDENLTASFTWAQNKDNYKVHFYSPFSNQTLTITGNKQNFKVTATDQEAANALALEQQLPFVQLRAWLLGLPAAGDYNASYDAYNQLETLQQDGWAIKYQSYMPRNPVSMPAKLTLEQTNMHVKIVIKSWD